MLHFLLNITINIFLVTDCIQLLYKVFWTGCYERHLVTGKLSYSYFVCACCYKSDMTVQKLSVENGRFVKKWAGLWDFYSY